MIFLSLKIPLIKTPVGSFIPRCTNGHRFMDIFSLFFFALRTLLPFYLYGSLLRQKQPGQERCELYVRAPHFSDICAHIVLAIWPLQTADLSTRTKLICTSYDQYFSSPDYWALFTFNFLNADLLSSQKQLSTSRNSSVYVCTPYYSYSYTAIAFTAV